MSAHANEGLSGPDTMSYLTKLVITEKSIVN